MGDELGMSISLIIPFWTIHYPLPEGQDSALPSAPHFLPRFDKENTHL